MKKRLICILLLIILIFSFLLFRLNKYYSIACDAYAETVIKGEISKETNNIILDHLNENTLQYSDITNIERANDQSISAITINTIKLNNIANELAYEIYDSIYESEKGYSLPLGNALGYKYLSGKGPEIEMSLIPLNAVKYNIKSEFTGSGINQTVHRIIIEFTTTVNCVAPFHHIKCELNFPIVITETLIVGKIPEIILSS